MDEKKLYVLTCKNKETNDYTTIGVFSGRDVAASVILTLMFEDGERAIYCSDDSISEIFETDKYFYTIEDFTVDEFY